MANCCRMLIATVGSVIAAGGEVHRFGARAEVFANMVRRAGASNADNVDVQTALLDQSGK